MRENESHLTDIESQKARIRARYQGINTEELDVIPAAPKGNFHEGISGTSLQHRKAFVNMISDCQNGNIDLIVTKTVARFARNILGGIGSGRIP